MSGRHYEGLDSHLVDVDENTPDRILARSEPLHEGDEDCDADLLPVDDGMDINAAGIRAIPKDALKHLLMFIIPSTSISPRKRFRVSQLRLVTLAHLAGIESIGDKTLTELADQLGVTRALMSLYSTRMVDQLRQQQTRGGKRRKARQTYRESAIRYHRRAGHQMNGDKQPELQTS